MSAFRGNMLHNLHAFFRCLIHPLKESTVIWKEALHPIRLQLMYLLTAFHYTAFLNYICPLLILANINVMTN